MIWVFATEAVGWPWYVLIGTVVTMSVGAGASRLSEPPPSGKKAAGGGEG